MPNLKMTPEFEQAVRAAGSADAIKETIQAEIARQTAADEAEVATAAAAAKAATDKVAADKIAADAVAAAAAAAASQKGFTRTEVIGGKPFDFEAPTEEKLNELVLNAYRVSNALGGAAPQTSQPDAAKEAADRQAAADLEVARQTALQTKMQRGEISVTDYLKESGAVAEYLDAQGISIETLKNAVAQSQATELQQSWTQATETFLSGPGARWPGGKKNQDQLQTVLMALRLEDADDKVGALVQAYDYMKSHDMVYANDAVTSPADDKFAADAAAKVAVDAAAKVAGLTPEIIAATKTPEQLQALVDSLVLKALADKAAADAAAIEAAKHPRTSSSMFNASSGVFGGGDGAGSTEARVRSDAAVAQSLKDVRPDEILAAWNQAQIAGGKDPNSAFMDAFRKR